jgi:hypothetical protein
LVSPKGTHISRTKLIQLVQSGTSFALAFGFVSEKGWATHAGIRIPTAQSSKLALLFSPSRCFSLRYAGRDVLFEQKRMLIGEYHEDYN